MMAPGNNTNKTLPEILIEILKQYDSLPFQVHVEIDDDDGGDGDGDGEGRQEMSFIALLYDLLGRATVDCDNPTIVQDVIDFYEQVLEQECSLQNLHDTDAVLLTSLDVSDFTYAGRELSYHQPPQFVAAEQAEHNLPEVSLQFHELYILHAFYFGPERMMDFSWDLEACEQSYLPALADSFFDLFLIVLRTAGRISILRRIPRPWSVLSRAFAPGMPWNDGHRNLAFLAKIIGEVNVELATRLGGEALEMVFNDFFDFSIGYVSLFSRSAETFSNVYTFVVQGSIRLPLIAYSRSRILTANQRRDALNAIRRLLPRFTEDEIIGLLSGIFQKPAKLTTTPVAPIRRDELSEISKFIYEFVEIIRDHVVKVDRSLVPSYLEVILANLDSGQLSIQQIIDLTCVLKVDPNSSTAKTLFSIIQKSVCSKSRNTTDAISSIDLGNIFAEEEENPRRRIIYTVFVLSKLLSGKKYVRKSAIEMITRWLIFDAVTNKACSLCLRQLAFNVVCYVAASYPDVWGKIRGTEFVAGLCASQFSNPQVYTPFISTLTSFIIKNNHNPLPESLTVQMGQLFLDELEKAASNDVFMDLIDSDDHAEFDRLCGVLTFARVAQNEAVNEKCEVLATKCISALSTTEKHDARRRITRLVDILVFATRCLNSPFLPSSGQVNQRDFPTPFTTNLLSTLQMDSDVTLIAACSFARASRTSFEIVDLDNISGELTDNWMGDDVISDPEQVGTSSASDAEDTIPPTEKRPPLTEEVLVDEAALFVSVQLLKRVIEQSGEIDSSLENRIGQVLDLLTFEKLDPRLKQVSLKQISDVLFDVYKLLAGENGHEPRASSNLIGKVVDKIADIISAFPNSELLKKFLGPSYDGPRAAQNIAESLNRLITTTPVEPVCCVQMPQASFAVDPSVPNPLAENPPASSKIVRSAAASFILDPKHNIFLNDGITLAFWIAAGNHRKHDLKSFPLHIASIGTPMLRAHVYYYPSTGSVSAKVFLLGQPIGKEFVVRRLFKPALEHESKITWHNVSFGLRTTQDCHVHFAAFIGGRYYVHNTTIVPPNYSASVPIEICLGSTVSTTPSASQVPIYELSTVTAFKGVLPLEGLVVFRALGCEASWMTECCASDSYTSFRSTMESRSLMAAHPRNIVDVVYEPRRYIHKYQRNVLCVVNASTAHNYSLSVFQRGIDTERISPLLWLTMYKDAPIEWQCPIVNRMPQTLDAAFRAIGSVKICVFLMALTVDRAYDAAAQLAAIRLLFSTLRRSSRFYGEFVTMNGFYVLAQIMNTPSSHMTDPIFVEIVNFIFSNIDFEANGQPKVSYYTVILEPNLLKTLIEMTELWRASKLAYFVRLLRIVKRSLSPTKTKFAGINNTMLDANDFLTALLTTILDMQQTASRFMTDDDDETEIVVKSVSSITKRLAYEDKYRVQAVIALWNFIFLSQTAQDTYLDFTLKSHTEWIRPEEIVPDPGTVTSLQGDGDGDGGGDGGGGGDTDEEALAAVKNHCLLADYLDDLLRRGVDKEELGNIWKSTQSIAEIKDELRKCWNLDGCVEYCEGPCSVVSGEKDDNKTLETDPPVTLSSKSSVASIETRPSSPEQSQDPPPPSPPPLALNWLTGVRSNLIDQMQEIVLNCEDSLMAVIELDVVSWETIVVHLTNQPDLQVRNNVFKLLTVFLNRCAEGYRARFIQMQGFVLLAAQIQKYPVTMEITDSLFSIFIGEAVNVVRGLDQHHVHSVEPTPFRNQAFHALFSLLESSVADSAVFWLVCASIKKMYDMNSSLRRAMFECGIVDTMVNVLRLLCAQTPSVKPLIGPVFPLFDCWMSFAVSIINSTVAVNDEYMYTCAQDLIHLCFVADFEFTTFQANRDSSRLTAICLPVDDPSYLKCACQMVRRTLCVLVDTWIDAVQAVVLDPFAAANLKPVDERPEATGSMETGFDDEEFEVYYSDSDFTSSLILSEGGAPRGDGKKRRQKINQIIPFEELSRRLIFGLQASANLFSYLQIPEWMTTQEECLFHKFIEILMIACKGNFADGNKRLAEWFKVLCACKDTARSLLAEVIAFILFSVQSLIPTPSTYILHLSPIDEAGLLRRRCAIVRLMASELDESDACLNSLLNINLDYQYGMKIALHELALCPKFDHLWIEYGKDFDRLIRFLRKMQLESPLANLTQDEIRTIVNDQVLIVQSYLVQKARFIAALRDEAERLCSKDDQLIRVVYDKAKNLTCVIAEYQNKPRKAFVQNCGGVKNACAEANEVLSRLVLELCHPEASFFDATSWPKGSSLDTTENSYRERKRLKPDHYRFDVRFLKPGRREEVGTTGSCPPPLQRLRESCSNYATTDCIEASNKVHLSLTATLVRTAFECLGEIIISDRKIHFMGEIGRSTQKGAKCNPVTYAWAYKNISEIYYRFYALKDTALELFTTTGDAFLIVFGTLEERNIFVNQLKASKHDGLFVDEERQLKRMTDLWRNGNTTNFDYLMTLNKLAGRSFNDLMQYPVLPFILSNYSFPTLDLTLSTSFRDLSTPIAIQNPGMRNYYISSYNQLADEAKESRSDEPFTAACFGGYHYGSHYSNTGIVAHYLVRVPPYTNVALEYQDNNFDIPDRLFISMNSTWRLASSESTTDFKELTPEFFFFPEMFRNREQLNLGRRQIGVEVGDVKMPKWCPGNSSRIFVLVHRQALESPHVANNLHQWIDLIFGYKQQGEAAIKAINVFHPVTYRGRAIEDDENHDEISLPAIRTMIRTYGQMPMQLFRTPHLPRLIPMAGASSESTTLPLPPGSIPGVLQTVQGLQWGNFVGSPDMESTQWAIPSLTMDLSSQESFIKLVPIHREAVCYGLPDKTELILKLQPDSRDPLRRAADITTTAMVSWAFNDAVLRIKMIQGQESLWISLIDLQLFQPTQVAHSPSADRLFIGTTCGLIRVYSLEYSADSRIWNVKLVSEILAHTTAISTLTVCDDFHFVFSTSKDAKCCLWDTNHLTFVRSLVPPPLNATSSETVTLAAVSSISADIAVIYQSGKGSRMVLYTVNGDVVGVYATELTMTALAMTTMQEGTGVNCIAIGFQNGVIRLIESWTLSHVCDITAPTPQPIMSVAFTAESRRLYAALANRTVHMWQVSSSGSTSLAASYSSSSISSMSKSKQSKFRMLNAFA